MVLRNANVHKQVESAHKKERQTKSNYTVNFASLDN